MNMDLTEKWFKELFQIAGESKKEVKKLSNRSDLPNTERLITYILLTKQIINK